jgi:hypothetical protein
MLWKIKIMWFFLKVNVIGIEFSSLNVKKNELVIFNTDNFDIKETLKIKNYV